MAEPIWNIKFDKDDGSVKIYYNGIVYSCLTRCNIQDMNMEDNVKRASTYILDMVKAIIENNDFEEIEMKNLLTVTGDVILQIANILH